MTALRTDLHSDLDTATRAVDALSKHAIGDDVQLVAGANQALRDAAIHPAETAVDFGLVAYGSPRPARTIRLLGPPVARSCRARTSQPWVHADLVSDGLVVSVDTVQPGRRTARIRLTGLVGVSGGWGGLPQRPVVSASAGPGSSGALPPSTGGQRQGTAAAAKVQVPDVRGATEATAKQTLSGKGFKATVSYRSGTSQTPGTVIGTTLVPGRRSQPARRSS
ncbi:PASTA domain-containing protein [Dactylosporangium cerinum]|uniref:PASTA domain-containing protein n=1 Tax=Dactylosporangium cerinum TaxID=1434730 RepID=A0ABV9WCF9_9ACTN